MKVFVLIEDVEDYDNYPTVEGVFASEEAAMRFAVDHVEQSGEFVPPLKWKREEYCMEMRVIHPRPGAPSTLWMIKQWDVIE